MRLEAFFDLCLADRRRYLINVLRLKQLKG